MKTYLAQWIFILGVLLKLQCANSNFTETDSKTLNIIVDNSTDSLFDKQLRTNHESSNDSFSTNNVITGSSPSSQLNEQCNKRDCARNISNSTSMNNSSSASKILWNLVDNVKSTNEPISDEITESEQTAIPQLNSEMKNYHNVHNSSFYSSDNELDSEVNFDHDIPEITHSREVINSSSSVPTLLDFGFTTSQSIVEENKNVINYSGSLNKNNTNMLDADKIYSDSLTSDFNISNVENVTEYLSSSEIPETTIYYADEDLDSAEHFFSLLFNSNITENNDTQVPFNKNLTTDVPYIENDSLNYEYNESSTLMPATVTTQSEILEENNTDEVHKYISLESEEMNPNYDVLNKTTAVNESAVFTHTTVTPDVTLVDGHLWIMNEDSSNMLDTTVSNHIDNASSKIDSGTESFYTSTEKYDASSEHILLSEISRKNNLSLSLEIETSTQIVFVTDQGESQMSASHYAPQNISFNSTNSSKQSIDNDLWSNVPTNNSELDFTELANFNSSDVGTFSNEELSNVHTTSVNFLTTLPVNTDNFSETPVSKISSGSSHDIPISDVNTQNTTLSVTGMETEFSGRRETYISSYEELDVHNSTAPNIAVNVNLVHENATGSSSTESLPYSRNINEEENNLLQTNPAVASSEKKSTEKIYSTSELTEINVTTVESYVFFTTETNPVSGVDSPSEVPIEIPASTRQFVSESNNSSENIDQFSHSMKESGNYLTTHDSFDVSVNHTENALSGVITRGTDDKESDNETQFYSSLTTESALTSKNVDVVTDYTVTSDSVITNSSISVLFHPTLNSEKSVEVMSSEKVTEGIAFSETSVTDSESSTTKKYTFPSSVDVSTLGVTETYREGKHIPFSSTVARSTTEFPRFFNITVKTITETPHHETTENSFLNLIYNQIKADDLSPEERSNLINAVVKLPDTFYSPEMVNEKIAIIHLWILHAIADEYKNASLNLSGSNDGQLDEIEFENLPQIMYVLPTPDIYLPHISFTFVVHNKWRNDTYPVDLILTILNLHIEDLKHLVHIEEIRLSHGLLVQKHDLLSVIIEKYGIILLSTCLITVAMILLLICVVIYYRRKTRYSAHCLTNDKLRRNMQDTVGIDLNPAVVILQDEIREKAALNGNKICNLDDDEGWLAPINDVPVSEDNNTPFVQDTKL